MNEPFGTICTVLLFFGTSLDRWSAPVFSPLPAFSAASLLPGVSALAADLPPAISTVSAAGAVLLLLLLLPDGRPKNRYVSGGGEAVYDCGNDGVYAGPDLEEHGDRPVNERRTADRPGTGEVPLSKALIANQVPKFYPRPGHRTRDHYAPWSSWTYSKGSCPLKGSFWNSGTALLRSGPDGTNRDPGAFDPFCSTAVSGFASPPSADDGVLPLSTGTLLPVATGAAPEIFASAGPPRPCGKFVPKLAAKLFS